MKISSLLLTTLAALAATSAHASVRYELTLTNGSLTPLSPFVVYAKEGSEADVQVGETASRGFVAVCQTGATAERLMELRANRAVGFVTQTSGLLMPGESRTVEVEVADPAKQSIHFETMYGKTKDVCGVGSINSHSLYALKEHVNPSYVGKDDTLLTGAFADPVLPATNPALANYTCAQSKDAVSCLRELSVAAMGGKIRSFSGYLPSVVSFLEAKYGAADTLSLLFPASGAIRFQVKLKH